MTSRPVALVTGGGRGIGAAISHRLAKDGYDVLLTYNSSSKPAEMVVDEIRNSGGDALAVGPEGKRVNVLAPGYVDTDILAGDSDSKRAQRIEEVPLKRIGTGDDMASIVSFLLSDDAAYITGAVLHANGGLYLP